VFVNPCKSPHRLRQVSQYDIPVSSQAIVADELIHRKPRGSISSAANSPLRSLTDDQVLFISNMGIQAEYLKTTNVINHYLN